MNELDHLQTIQNAAVRLLGTSNRQFHITPILRSLDWLHDVYRIPFKVLILTYRALHSQAPAYVTELLQPYSSARSPESNMLKLLSVSCTCLNTHGDRAVKPRQINYEMLYLYPYALLTLLFLLPVSTGVCITFMHWVCILFIFCVFFLCCVCFFHCVLCF